MLWSHLLYVTYTIFKQPIYVGNTFETCVAIFEQHMYGICSP